MLPDDRVCAYLRSELCYADKTDRKSSSSRSRQVMAVLRPTRTLDQFFAGQERSRPLFDLVAHVVEGLGDGTVRVTKSQIAFRRRKAFAWAWVPGKVLRGERPPLVLSVSLSRPAPSRRWKQIVEPVPGRFMHHLEIHAADEVDEEVQGWLRQAWKEAA